MKTTVHVKATRSKDALSQQSTATSHKGVAVAPPPYGIGFVDSEPEEQESHEFLIQPKLSIGRSDDKYEKEADRVAAQVMRQMNAPTLVPSVKGEVVQRRFMPEEKLQLKQAIGGDEMEAMIGEDELQMMPLAKPGQSGMVQRLQVGEGEVVTPAVEASIQRGRGSGQPLAESVRVPMEQAFGVDFKGVKVHTDGESDRLNRALSSRAFTTGQDLFFQQGEYNPESRNGQELVGHELTHVVQQNRRLLQQAPAGLNVQKHPVTVPQIQRGIKKTKKMEGNYKTAPVSVNGVALSRSVKQELQKIIDDNEKTKTGKDYTLTQALRVAEKRVGESGRFETGRSGTRIKNKEELVDFMQSKGADTKTLEDKFSRVGTVIDAALETVEVVQDDFKAIPVTTTPDKLHQNVVSTLNTVVPRLTRTFSAFNEVGENMVKQGGALASSYKGSMFENLTKFTLNVLPLGATKRITFLKQGLMQAERTSDGYDSNTQTLWDMKHQFSNVPKDQAEDYSEILVKGYTAKDGLSKVKTVNYLFPSKEAAEQNKWLNTNYGFGVFYGEKTSMKQLA